MRPRTALLFALIALAPASAAAIDYYEEGVTFTYWGRQNVITRDASFYPEATKPSVEIECDGHGLATPDEARHLAEVLRAAAAAAEAP